MEAERFLLKWNNHQSNLVTVFDQLYEQEAFTDVTLACDGKSFAAHKVILSACSPYFQGLFLANPNTHPIVFMRDVRGSDLESLLAFMYRGEINVHQQDLASFLKTAESLQIKGLSDSSERQRDTSKILEAMEKKFNTAASNNNNTHNSNNNNQAHSNNNNNTYTSNHNNSTRTNNISSSSYCSTPPPATTPTPTNCTSSSSIISPNSSLVSSINAFGMRNIPPRVSSALSTLSSLHLHGAGINGGLSGAYGGLGAALPVLAAAGNGYTPENLSSSSITSSECRSPPAKRHRSLEDLPRILPKVRSGLTNPPSLISNIPGLLTPITLAAAAVNSVAAQPQMPILANTPTSVHASPPTPETSSSSLATESATPPKEPKRDQSYLSSSDSPHHPEYYGSNSLGGGVGGSGSSTPSMDVKEEEGYYDDGACLSDEHNNLTDDGHMEDNKQGIYDVLNSSRDRLSYPCRYCGKRFTQTGTCRRHERLHTAPNGFKCPFCQKGFNRKYRLKEHIISSHPSSADEADLSMIVNSAASGIA